MLYFLIGLITGFFDALVGAGGLISIPALVLLGLSPKSAIATDRLGVLGQYLVSFSKYFKAQKIVWRYVFLMIALSLVGAWLGAKVLLTIDPQIMENLVGVFLLLILSSLFLSREIGVERKNTSLLKKTIGFFLYFLLMIISGFWGQGIGPFITMALSYFIGLTFLEVMATRVLPGLFFSFSSVLFFSQEGLINYPIGLILLCSMSLGSYGGTKLVLIKGNRWIKVVFGIFVFFLSLKMFFY